MTVHADDSGTHRRAARYVLFGGLAVALALLFQGASLVVAHHGRPLDMIRLLRPDSTPSVAGYDGAFFLALAQDPLAGPRTVAALDAPLIRARRIGFPLAAWALAPVAGGPARALLLVLALATMATIGLLQSSAFANRVHPALCCAVALALPLAVSTELVTAEVLATALILGAAAAERGRHDAVAVALLAAACLSKELAILAVVAFVICHLRARALARAASYATALVPLALWHLHLVAHLGGVPAGGSQLAMLTLGGRGFVGQIGVSAAQLLAGMHVAKATGLLLTVTWFVAGAFSALWLVWARATPGSALACLGGLLALVLSRGAPFYAYDEIFNFGRQLFLLPVGMFVVFFVEHQGLSRRARFAVAAWLIVGAVLGAAWWGHQIWMLRMAVPR
jgi:hypothetical protein